MCDDAPQIHLAPPKIILNLIQTQVLMRKQLQLGSYRRYRLEATEGIGQNQNEKPWSPCCSQTHFTSLCMSRATGPNNRCEHSVVRTGDESACYAYIEILNTSTGWMFDDYLTSRLMWGINRNLIIPLLKINGSGTKWSDTLTESPARFVLSCRTRNSASVTFHMAEDTQRNA